MIKFFPKLYKLINSKNLHNLKKQLKMKFFSNLLNGQFLMIIVQDTSVSSTDTLILKFLLNGLN